MVVKMTTVFVVMIIFIKINNGIKIMSQCKILMFQQQKIMLCAKYNLSFSRFWQ